MLQLYGCFRLDRDRLHVYNNEADSRLTLALKNF